ncbi:MAG: hypothetical protein ACHQ52_09110, partial [Candidatus Eisenbacteria bacterium]
LALAATPPAHGPTLATEDTLHTEVSPVLVSAPRVTLDEILDRVAQGEARRDSSMHDQVCTAALRVYRQGHRDTMQLLEEGVWRVYKERPDRLRSVPLRHRLGAGVKDEDMEADFTPDMGERIVDFAFQPEARRDFRYRIVGRDLVGDHLVYRIAFEPRTTLDATRPHGLVWIDTNEFVIVREELGFERSPVPLFVRQLDGLVVERQRVDECWVLHRVLMNIELTVPMPHVGRRIQFAIVFDDYAVNRGIDPAVFAPATKKR